MKIKEGFVLKNIGDNHIVVPVGAQTVDFRSMITLNGSGAFLWERLTEDSDEASLLQALQQEYDVDAETARQDIAVFLQKLQDNRLLEE